MKIEISGKVRSELLDAYRYLADRNPAAAENFVSDVNLKLDQLSRFPYIGRERAEFRPDLRSIWSGPSLSFIGSATIELRSFVS